VYPLGDLRGLVPIPYVASRTQDMAIREASPLGHHSTLPAGGRVPWVCQESGAPEPPKPRLLDRVRRAIETRHYSRRTGDLNSKGSSGSYPGARRPKGLGRPTNRGSLLLPGSF